MKRIITIIAALVLASSAVSAQTYYHPECKVTPDQVIELYPVGQDPMPYERGRARAIGIGPVASNGITEKETIGKGGGISNITNPRIEIYLPEKCNGQMVVVCPGGGYGFTSSWNEGQFVAEWFKERGIATAVVEYRMPNGHWEIPLTDVQNAFRFCRENAAKWGVNQIGVMGFSAGGHLAASATNLFVDEVTRPDFSILIYPVITMERGVTHNGTRNNLIGKDEVWAAKGKTKKEKKAAAAEHQALIDRYSIEKQITANTPPSFIAHCTDDKTVPIENAVRYYTQLTVNKVPAEMHIWPKGGHGWGFTSAKYGGKNFEYARAEFEASLERWLKGLLK